MLYRIRYRCGAVADAHAEVEANSPLEAMVKFRHTHTQDMAPSPKESAVISICQQERQADDAPSW